LQVEGPSGLIVGNDGAVTDPAIQIKNQFTSSDPSMTVYPNPSAGEEVRITLSNIESIDQDIIIEVYDIAGRRIASRQLGNSGYEMQTVIRFDQRLSTGLYLVNVNINNETQLTERLIVK
jgi:hypothetical protein